MSFQRAKKLGKYSELEKLQRYIRVWKRRLQKSVYLTERRWEGVINSPHVRLLWRVGIRKLRVTSEVSAFISTTIQLQDTNPCKSAFWREKASWMGSWSLGAVVVETSAFKIGKRQFRCVAVNYTREDRLFSEKETPGGFSSIWAIGTSVGRRCWLSSACAPWW